LIEIKSFLDNNAMEIITIFIEDYVNAPFGLTKVFTSAGLMKYWFPLSNMPVGGADWPTLDTMIQMNQRLIVFTSMDKEATEGIAHQWNFTNENQCMFFPVSIDSRFVLEAESGGLTLLLMCTPAIARIMKSLKKLLLWQLPRD
jgi:hypothetical protein